MSENIILDINNEVYPITCSFGDIDSRTKNKSNSLSNELEKRKLQMEHLYFVSYKELSIKETINGKEYRFIGKVPLSKENCDVTGIIVAVNKDECTLEKESVYISRLKMAAYLYMKEMNIVTARILLIKGSLDQEECDKIFLDVRKDELKNFFLDNIEKYLKWCMLLESWKTVRNDSIKKMSFPFESYREGQRDLAKKSYIAILHNKVLFAQAPTGIGKTVSTLFPSIKAIGEELTEKVFYLTAKTVGARVAEESLGRMRDNGLNIRSITITAKEKVCLNSCISCNPIECIYAKNYYGKVNEAISLILEREGIFSKDVLEQYSKKFKVCPFELSLDLSLYCDIVICDYNYVFDPIVHLQRYFESSNSKHVLIVDEAHNLVDRAKKMYSADIPVRILSESLDFCKNRFENLEKLLSEVLIMIQNFSDLSKNRYYITDKFPSALANKLVKINNKLTEILNRHKDVTTYDKLAELHSILNRFISIADFFDYEYRFYVSFNNDNVLGIFCIDPSKNLIASYKKAESTILISATLSPLQYYKNVLGGSNDSYSLKLESPYDKRKRKVLLIDTISTRYRDREIGYDSIINYINAIVSKKQGNYMVFAPSFEYMDNIYSRYIQKYTKEKVIKQEKHMSELERAVYLANFEIDTNFTLVSFNVVSGIFGEGIDLVGNRLIGAIIIGIGLPSICFERDMIKKFYDDKRLPGFDYAYTFPGINRVIQAAGRVIRTENDFGIITLIDDRYSEKKYRQLLPIEWNDLKVIKNMEQMQKEISGFWTEIKSD